MYYKNEARLITMPIIRIEKSSLRTIIGKALEYTSPVRKQVIRSVACASCPEGSHYLALEEKLQELAAGCQPNFRSSMDIKENMDAIDHMCITSGCGNCQVKKHYQNDKKDFNLYCQPHNDSSRQIPKNAVRLFLLLYSLPQSLLGETHFIRNLSAQKAADYLSCSLPTLRRSLKTLEDSGYITLSHAGDLKHYHIILNRYDTMHLPAQKGGCGYISLDRNALDALLSVKNVNQLRLELLCLLRYDNAQLVQGRKPLWENYSFRDLRNMLPAHMNYRAKFEQILSKDKLLAHYINGQRIYFRLKEQFPLHFDYKKIISDSHSRLQSFFMEKNIPINENEIICLSEMATQYDVTLIIRCVSSILKQYPAFSAVRNLPGLVRRCCANIAMGNPAAI